MTCRTETTYSTYRNITLSPGRMVWRYPLRHIFGKCLVQISVFPAAVPKGIIRDIYQLFYVNVGRDSVDGIATQYGLDGPRLKSRLGVNFLHSSIPPVGSTQLPVKWVPTHPVEVKEGVEVSFCTFMACYRVKFTLLLLYVNYRVRHTVSFQILRSSSFISYFTTNDMKPKILTAL